MFARKIKIEIAKSGALEPCPIEWLDSFSMRSFTGRSAFDDTLPTADGELETGFRVDLAALRADMEDWMTKKFGKGQPVKLRLSIKDSPESPAAS